MRVPCQDVGVPFNGKGELFQGVGLLFQGVRVPCKDVEVPFKGVSYLSGCESAHSGSESVLYAAPFWQKTVTQKKAFRDNSTNVLIGKPSEPFEWIN